MIIIIIIIIITIIITIAIIIILLIIINNYKAQSIKVCKPYTTIYTVQNYNKTPLHLIKGSQLGAFCP